MDVYQTLLQDHQTIWQILSNIEKTNVSEAERRELFFSTLREKLEAHEILEETVFYPEIDKFPDRGRTRERGVRGAHRIRRNPIGDIRVTLERVAELKDLVQQHVINEENRMFPAARNELPDSRAEQLGRKIQELKRKDAPDRSFAGPSNRVV